MEWSLRWRRNGVIMHIEEWEITMKSSEIKEVIEDRSRLRANRLGMRRDALDGFVSEDGFATIHSCLTKFKIFQSGNGL